MEKLLHERLRECKDVEELDKSVGLCHQETDWLDTFNALADEIERYYIPRPRFEDGEPVQFGDEVAGLDDPVSRLVIYDDGSGEVGNYFIPFFKGVGFGGSYDRPIKHPEPKALDADNVAIREGDTLWLLYGDHHSFVVDGFFKHHDMFLVTEVCSNGEKVNYNPKKLTHKEPDSYEKVRNDILDLAAEERSVSIIDEALHCFADRITSIMERDNE